MPGKRLPLRAILREILAAFSASEPPIIRLFDGEQLFACRNLLNKCSNLLGLILAANAGYNVEIELMMKQLHSFT